MNKHISKSLKDGNNAFALEDAGSTSVSSDLEDDEYRSTLFESAIVRASEKKEHISPYKVRSQLNNK